MLFWSQNSLTPWSCISISSLEKKDFVYWDFLKTHHTDLRMNSVLRNLVKCYSKNGFCHWESILT